MAGTMSGKDLVEDLKASMLDCATVFTAAGDADFRRHLDAAAQDFQRIRPRTVVGSLTLVADQAEYTAPADLVGYKAHLWGITPRQSPQPWEPTWPGRLPVVRFLEASGTRKLYLDPAPSAGQINVLGSDFRFYYWARHSVDHSTDGNTTTVPLADRALLLLRAQAEAMKEMSLRNIKKPMSLRDGLSSMPRNGMPQYLWGELMKEFERVAA